ncbi:sialidase-3-like [Scomber japonicus]|uniref:sialidase-3-like n=1 Tax=Scomber japonicus TaxID=13676 RepID=UPI00230589FB|nr:sialidase-3-like [Scomber japonicus]
MANKSLSLRTVEESKETLFTSDEEAVYRIPALIYLGDDNILAFAERRKTIDDASTVALDMRAGKVNRIKGTNPAVTIEWSDLNPVKEAQLPGYRPMNPCPVYEKNSKTLYLFFICVKDGVTEQEQIKSGNNQTHLCYIKSTDDGQTWSEVTEITENELVEIEQWATMAVGPGHGIQMKSGRLIVPLYAYYRHGCCCCFYCCCCCNSSFALCLYSDDQGNIWKLSKKLEMKSNECEMAEVFDDTGKSIIYCNARNAKYRVGAVSEDGGKEFSSFEKKHLKPACCDNKSKLVDTGTGCQGSVVSFPDQSEVQPDHNKWLLYSHPTDKHKRVKLGVYLNKTPQDPTQWSKPWIINSGPSGYSDLAYIDDGWFVCLMECGKHAYTEQIVCRIFSYDDAEQAIAE